MMRMMLPVTAAALLLALPLMLNADGGTQEFKGQIKIGMHRVKLEPKKLYEIILEGPKDIQLNVTAEGINLIHVSGSDFRDRKTYCMPNLGAEVTFLVSPGFGIGNFTTYDYVLKIKGMSLGDKPVLQDEGRWTGQDPLYAQRNLPFKDYKVNLKGGKLYIIDLVKGAPGLDPYLFLESPTGKVVAQDDDSGGDLNARIVYAPPQDGEFRIIAASLSKASGPFTLTVRQAE
jgi:hypothetical protein